MENMTILQRIFPLLTILSLAAGACASPPATNPATEAEDAVPIEAPPTQHTPVLEPVIPPEMERLVTAAKEDLAGRIGVGVDDLEVLHFETVTWSDSSLGCPQPGMAYLQVLVDGFRLVLFHADTAYSYHGTDSGFVLCENPREGGVSGDAPAGPEGTPKEGIDLNGEAEIDPGLAPLIEQAVADLAARLDVEPADVDVVSAVLVEWPDASMGCPVPGLRYPQVPQDGFLIQLKVGGQTYPYHGGGNREPFLCEPSPLQPKSTPPKLDDSLLPPPGGADS